MKYQFIILLLVSLLFYACGTSTGSRYGNKDTGKSSVKTKKEKRELKETFDITPYKTSIEIEDTVSSELLVENYSPELWYNYPENTDSTKTEIKSLQQTPGYRVLVFVSDYIEEADSVKSAIYFQTKKPTYVSFDPPFYRVKAGDFIRQTEASDFVFQLTQLGFTESKVIRDTVNIYK